VFADLYGNLWDLIEPRRPRAAALAPRFVARINAHDVEGIVALCTPAHLFIDSLGNRLTGLSALAAGWRAYFGLFQDYRIEVENTLTDEAAGLVLLSGWAAGRHAVSGRTFRIPAAWRLRPDAGLVAEWQVYADNKPVYDILAGSTGAQ